MFYVNLILPVLVYGFGILALILNGIGIDYLEIHKSLILILTMFGPMVVAISISLTAFIARWVRVSKLNVLNAFLASLAIPVLGWSYYIGYLMGNGMGIHYG